MNQIFLVTLTLALSLGLVLSLFPGQSPSFGQQNQTGNATSGTQSQQGQQQQQNQTEGIGSASQIENMTAGNIPVLGNKTDIESQNDTSVTEGMQSEQLTTDPNMTSNQTSGGPANQTSGGTANQTQAGGNETGQNPLEQIGETIGNIFGGGGGGN